MPEDKKYQTGRFGWVDLTVDNAEQVRDFYQQVVGWGSVPFSMGDYEDYCMTPPGSEQPVAGVCHARGNNAGLPPQWLMYITVEDLDKSLDQCSSLGGSVLAGPKQAGPEGRFAVIKDPAGAVCALYQHIVTNEE